MAFYLINGLEKNVLTKLLRKQTMSKNYKIFSEEEELELITNRYKNLKGKIPFTVAKLKSSDLFMNEILPKLKKKYPDWIIYQAIWTFTYNYRANLDRSGSLDDLKNRMMKKMGEIEKECDIEIPIAEYNLLNLERMVDFNVLAYLKGKGFEIRKKTPNFIKLKEFVDKRFKYFSLDIEHEDWFS